MSGSMVAFRGAQPLLLLLVVWFCHDSVVASTQEDFASARPVAFTEPVKATAPAGTPDQKAGSSSASATDGKAPTAPPPSRAEAITQLDRAIAADTERLEQARCDLDHPLGDYRQAEKLFRECDELLTAKKAELAKAIDPAKTAELNSELVDLEKKWHLARQSFDLSIEKRRTIQEQIAAIEEKISKNKTAVAQLLGEKTANADGGANGPTPTPNAISEPPPSPSPAPALIPPSASSGAPAPLLSAAPATASPPIPGLLKPAEPSGVKPPSKELVEAQNQVEMKRVEVSEAEQVAQSVSARIAALDNDIRLESKLLAAVRKKADVSYQTVQSLDSEYEKCLQDEAKRNELPGIWARRREAQAVFKQSREESRERSLRLDELQTQRAALQSEALHANDNLEAKLKEVSGAEGEVLRLQNPLSLHNTLQWALDHLPNIGVILFTMLAIRWVTRLSGKRIISVMVLRSSRGTLQEREDRARTLVSVFRSALSITVTIGGVLMICDELGVAIAPLMGGAAIFGLAVAFGAQNLIRDYFYGFVILIENQYKLNDVLKIGDISGQVEQITLRMTVLRDAEGNVHFIPNGKIDTVTNMTHGWSRAIIEVSIAYKENADFVMQILTELAFELKQDTMFGPYIIDDPEMLGVDSLGESAVTLKLMIKTRTFRQWPVKREMLRRIKRRFEELGIEIPFPHRTIFHRHEVGMEEAAVIERPKLAA